MNQPQRKFLIDKISGNGKEKIQQLQRSKMEWPSLSNYVFKAIMTGNLQLQSPEVILEALKQKAIKAKEGENWLSNERMGANKEHSIILSHSDLIVIPEDYKIERQRVLEHNKKIDDECETIKMQLNTLETRIQLASDKTLQKMIGEVDDMGDLSLIDVKLKLLN